MSELFEARTDVEAVPESGVARELPSPSAGISSSLPVLAPLALRQAKRRWNSSLSDRDLQCLLQIIEVDLVPQLLDNYSPARYAPDDRLTTS